MNYSRKGDDWCLDSGCSKHLCANRSLLKNYKTISDGDTITFGDKAKGRIVGEGDVISSGLKIGDVSYSQECKYNLLSISMLCDKGNHVIFRKHSCEIVDDDSGDIVASGIRVKKIYVLRPSD